MAVTEREEAYSMTISKNQKPPTRKLKANGKDIIQDNKFSYLASFLTADCKSDFEITRRIALGKDAFN